MLLGSTSAKPDLIASADGMTVFDTTLDVTWLANMDLGATMNFGLPVTTSGAMSYQTAVAWVQDLNAINYAGHSNWTLPNTPQFDAGSACQTLGANGNNFGYGCVSSSFGSLWQRLNLSYPNTAVPIPQNGKTGPFSNFQPYLYWSCTGKDGDPTECMGGAPPKEGLRAFSFNTGWRGANVTPHYMYVLPMVPGTLPGFTPIPGDMHLQPSADGSTVYDPVTNVTWLANADLAMSQTFGLCSANSSLSCINKDGSMSNDLAVAWIQGMNNYNNGPGKPKGWLGISNWQLPPAPDDPSCSLGKGTFGYTCSGSNDPLGELYYNQLTNQMTVQNPLQPVPDIYVGPFNDLQPYLYWSCGFATPSYCLNIDTPPDYPTDQMEWSFSFGNGFEGTDFIQNDLYVEPYAPAPEPATIVLALAGPLLLALARSCLTCLRHCRR